jgi:uncharacterized surface protein with fasciclin (FAS1) repeats
MLNRLRCLALAGLADTALLAQVLTYHESPSRALKAEVPVGTAVKGLQGDTLTVGATLASKGVIHVFDKVILPRP